MGLVQQGRRSFWAKMAQYRSSASAKADSRGAANLGNSSEQSQSSYVLAIERAAFLHALPGERAPAAAASFPAQHLLQYHSAGPPRTAHGHNLQDILQEHEVQYKVLPNQYYHLYHIFLFEH